MINDNKTSKSKLIICIAILIIICFCLGILINVIQNREKNSSLKQLEYINSDEWNDEEYPYTAYMLFIKYEGELTSENIVKSMSYVAKTVIPEYYVQLKNADEHKITKYYNKNSNLIKVDTGIESEREFKNFILNIQKLSSDELVFVSYKIDKDSIKIGNNYVEAKFYITYKDSTEIGFKVKINNTISENKSSVIYTALK